MLSSSTPPDGVSTDGVSPDAALRISDTAVARAAAYYAGRVPGVLRLWPDLAQTMASVSTRRFPAPDGEYRIPTDGVTAIVTDGRVLISVALVTRWGRNCRDIAEDVQDQVAEQIHSFTGLPATVSITIAEVDLPATR